MNYYHSNHQGEPTATTTNPSSDSNASVNHRQLQMQQLLVERQGMPFHSIQPLRHSPTDNTQQQQQQQGYQQQHNLLQQQQQKQAGDLNPATTHGAQTAPTKPSNVPSSASEQPQQQVAPMGYWDQFGRVSTVTSQVTSFSNGVTTQSNPMGILSNPNVPLVSSSGVLQPLVPSSSFQIKQQQSPDASSPPAPASNPKSLDPLSDGQQQDNEVSGCMDVIHQALQDPSFATAGHVLLKAMQASSTYMSSLMEEKKRKEATEKVLPMAAAADVEQPQRYFLDARVQSRSPVPVPVAPTFPDLTEKMQQRLPAPVAAALPQQQHLPKPVVSDTSAGPQQQQQQPAQQVQYQPTQHQQQQQKQLYQYQLYQQMLQRQYQQQQLQLQLQQQQQQTLQLELQQKQQQQAQAQNQMQFQTQVQTQQLQPQSQDQLQQPQQLQGQQQQQQLLNQQQMQQQQQQQLLNQQQMQQQQYHQGIQQQQYQQLMANYQSSQLVSGAPAAATPVALQVLAPLRASPTAVTSVIAPANSNAQTSSAQQQPSPLPYSSPSVSSTNSTDSPALSPKRSSSPKPKVHRAVCGKQQKGYRSKSLVTSFDGSPHQYLLVLLRERGYSAERVTSEDGGYSSEPTPLQLASFGTELVKAVHAKDSDTLRRLLSCGISPNPCNAFGDSILGLVCKRSDVKLFQCMVDSGCNLQVCDSFGRTPLHHMAWAATFSKDMIRTILDRDLNQLLVEDKRGQCPLEYVRRLHWAEWIGLLREAMDDYWPINQTRSKTPLPRDVRSESIRDPTNAVSPDLAFRVAAGTIKPEEVEAMDDFAKKNFKEQVPEEKYELFGAGR